VGNSRNSFSLHSDNCSPAHPRILEAMKAANFGYMESYGCDEYSEQAQEAFKDIFGEDIEVFFVFNGTGANVAALAACTNKVATGVICTDIAHINTAENGAPEKLIGVKLLPVPHSNGKLLPDQIKSLGEKRNSCHRIIPSVVSISQTTEIGSVYSQNELLGVTEAAHSNDMVVYMDGVRFANAVAALGCSPYSLSKDAGIDVMSFGGTKNGHVFGEAIVFFNHALAEKFSWLHKQMLQLAAKNRYIAVQFLASLEDGFWLKLAEDANHAAVYLADGLQRIAGVEITSPVESNMVFVSMPQELVEKLFTLTTANVGEIGTIRLVTSFCTTYQQIDNFLVELCS